MTTDLVTITPNDHGAYLAWDAFVRTSDQGSAFATTDYLNACNKPWQIHLLQNEHGILAGLPIVRGIGPFYRNPLLAKYLGVLYGPSTASYSNRLRREMRICKALIDSVAHIRSFRYTFHPEFTNWMPFYWSDYRQTVRYTYRIAAGQTADQLLACVQGKTRNILRKARKQGVRVTREVSIDQIFDLVEQTFRHQGGSSPYKRQALRHWYETLHQQGMVSVYGAGPADGEIEAAACVVRDWRSAYFVINGIARRGKDTGANALLVWEAILDAMEQGLDFDFEGSMLPGVESFYCSFGAKLTPYYEIWRPGLLNGAVGVGARLYKRLRYGR